MTALRHVVVDSSVVLKWVLPEAGRSKALALLDEYEAGQTNLIAPRLLREECASALFKRCRRRLDVSARPLRRPYLVAGRRIPGLCQRPR